LKVVVVTDLTIPVSPGMLCREYLMSVCDSESIIVMGGSDAKDDNDIIKCNMNDLWPHPYLYRGCDRSNIVDYANAFISRTGISIDSLLRFSNDDCNDINCNDINKEKFQKLHKVATAYTKYDDADALHPIRLATAVLFDDDSIEVTWMLKGLEYGCTIDAVSQMVSKMVQNRICGDCKLDITCNGQINGDSSIFKMIKNPVMLVNVDQYGVCHSPHAQARALLSEHGFDHLKIMVHNDNGIIEIVTVKSLVPNPNGVYVLSHDSFH